VHVGYCFINDHLLGKFGDYGRLGFALLKFR
jgi:hypothetical protein